MQHFLQKMFETKKSDLGALAGWLLSGMAVR
jgi:hypothetical protein